MTTFIWKAPLEKYQAGRATYHRAGILMTETTLCSNTLLGKDSFGQESTLVDSFPETEAAPHRLDGVLPVFYSSPTTRRLEL